MDRRGGVLGRCCTDAIIMKKREVSMGKGGDVRGNDGRGEMILQVNFLKSVF